jgi:hypothetical protein
MSIDRSANGEALPHEIMTTLPTTRALGDAAEARAPAYLVARGLLPVARNYRVAHGPARPRWRG